MNDINTLNHKISNEVRNLVTVVHGCCLLDGYEHLEGKKNITFC